MLGSRIAALRHQAGLSQSALAKRLGISPSAVGMYEQGRREPSVDILIAMGELFGVSLDYLLKGQVLDAREEQALREMLNQRLRAAEKRLARREQPPFTSQELALLFAAVLLE